MGIPTFTFPIGRGGLYRPLSITARTSASTTGGCFGYATGGNGRFYVQTSSNSTNGTSQPMMAIATTGLGSITVAYDIEMVSAQARTVGVVLQYRVGTSGSWNTVSGSAYLHSSTRTDGQVDSFTNLVLPSDADDRAVVQLRWAVWRGTMSGSSSGIALDNISITGSEPELRYFRTAQSGAWRPRPAKCSNALAQEFRRISCAEHNAPSLQLGNRPTFVP